MTTTFPPLTAPELRTSLDAAWEQISGLLFCGRTNLIYDYLGSTGKDRFDFLPFPEEIEHDFPNPRGYATGMEDSALNGGIMIHAALLRARLFPETAEECCAFAAKLLRGLELCATVHGREGYVVRSVSHRDGTSCYSCSSRDQLTFWVWGLWRYFRSDAATEPERERIRSLVVKLAARGEREVVSENQYSYLTLGGVPDSLLQMDEVLPHEILRLPMFYLAAWKLSGDAHWRACYDRMIGRALRRAAEPKEDWNHFELSQFLLTLALCHELDPRPEFSAIAREIGDVTEEMLCGTFLPELEKWRGTWSIPATAWRNSTALRLVHRSDGGVVSYGKLDLRCGQTPGFHDLFNLVRIPGNLMTGLLLAPGRQVREPLIRRFLKAFCRPDYRRSCSCSSVNVLYAALLGLERLGGIRR